jgi:hypothetical protein
MFIVIAKTSSVLVQTVVLPGNLFIGGEGYKVVGRFYNEKQANREARLFERMENEKRLISCLSEIMSST